MNKMLRTILAVWLLIVLAILLAPDPRAWGAFGQWISPHYNRLQAMIQPATHLILMAVLAALLVHCFSSRPVGKAIIYSFVLTIAFAAMLEVLQSTLPPRFSRSCDANDLVPALVGACIGCGTVFFKLFRKEY